MVCNNYRSRHTHTHTSAQLVCPPVFLHFTMQDRNFFSNLASTSISTKTTKPDSNGQRYHWLFYLLITIALECCKISNTLILFINISLLLTLAFARIHAGPVLSNRILKIWTLTVYACLLGCFEFAVITQLKVTFAENLLLMLLHFVHIYTYLLRQQINSSKPSIHLLVTSRLSALFGAGYLINLTLTSICYPKYYASLLLLMPHDCSFVYAHFR